LGVKCKKNILKSSRKFNKSKKIFLKNFLNFIEKFYFLKIIKKNLEKIKSSKKLPKIIFISAVASQSSPTTPQPHFEEFNQLEKKIRVRISLANI
jgi:hypothetical protein